MKESVEALDYIEHSNTQDTAEYVIIWLHGLGASGQDFLPFAKILNLTAKVKFIFPNAPYREITINNKHKMRAWYDIISLEDRVVDSSIFYSVKQVELLIDEQVQSGFSFDKIFLGGFSQGGVVSYAALLLIAHKIRGFLCLSCYLPDDIACRNNINRTTPVYASHGLYDRVVPYTLGIKAHDKIKSLGYNIRWQNFSAEHTVNDIQINSINSWLNNNT